MVKLISKTCKVHHWVLHFYYDVLDPANAGQALAGLALEANLQGAYDLSETGQLKSRTRQVYLPITGNQNP
jgi:hypothetical protein